MGVPWSRVLDGTAAVAMIIASATIIWVMLSGGQPGQGPGPDKPVTQASVEDVALPSLDVSGPLRARLRSGASHLLLEFSDFQCPYCGRHAREVFPLIWKEFVETGKIDYVFRHFPLEKIHPNAIDAAMAVECATSQDRFWALHDRLFANQQTLSRPQLVDHASAIGLEREIFEACLGDQVKATVLNDMELGRELGVKATPSFFVGRVKGGKIELLKRIRGAQPYSTFRTVLTELVSSK